MVLLAFYLTLAALALLGHGVLWVAVANRLHAVPLGYQTIHVFSGISRILLVGVPGLYSLWFLHIAMGPRGGQLPRFWDWPVAWYIVGCWAIAAYHLPKWLYRRMEHWRPVPQLRTRGTETIDVVARLGGRWPLSFPISLLAHVPGNQAMQVHMERETIALAGLDAALEGLRVVHLSDLHMSGMVERAFFDEIVDVVNRLDADIVLVTGDVCDTAACIDWIPATLGRLRSRHGVFYVLGNHDLRTGDVPRLRATLDAAGWIDAGGRRRDLETRGRKIALVGNELPWFGSKKGVRNLFREMVPDTFSLKIALCHSPDQFGWARRMGFDLALAGHTHGGQIRLPLVGPIVCPTWTGLRYASGVFYEAPTVLRVSRGVSSLLPLRLNCPPEIAELTLVSDRGPNAS